MQNKYEKQDIRSEKLDPILNILSEVSRLKTLFRQGWLKRGIPESKCESVADHCFLTVITAYLIAERDFPELDLTKVLKLAIIHEIGEVYVGDITPVDGVSEEEKYKQEREAVKSVFSELDDGNGYLNLWEEFEAGETPEASFVKQIDKLEMALQAYNYKQHGYDRMDEFLDSTARVMQDDRLKDILKGML
ncbi:MAG: HD domain-containing protein [Candidatus Zophobacter franzmannii]|jgi:putative hydrolase of HD superfamily|nr:HD domain-containing protein [Candidatus Zophobacter franzmannii]